MRRNHRMWIAGLALLAVLVGAGVWLRFLDPTLAQARVATGYLAKTVCSCMFVEGQGLEACRADALLDRGEALSRVRIAADARGRRVRASLFPLAFDTASFEEGYGCTLN